MDKLHKIGIYIWLIVLTVMCIITLVRTFYRNVTLEVDYSGILVGILSALCTVLIGWQIFALIEFSKKEELNKQKIDELNTEYDNYVKLKNENDYLIDYALGDIYASMLDLPAQKHPAYNFVRYRIMALTDAAKINQLEICNNIIANLIHFIQYHNLNLTKMDKEHLINLLLTMNLNPHLKNFSTLLELISRQDVRT